jgi:TRAP-type C4-dicarboxylate transport system substrate-binding protein
MVQPVFFDIAKPFFDKLSPEQKTVLTRAAANAAKLNDSGRLNDEKAIVEALRGRGLAVDAIDLAPFRAMADKVYGEADITKAWNAALAKQVIETR